MAYKGYKYVVERRWFCPAAWAFMLMGLVWIWSQITVVLN